MQTITFYLIIFNFFSQHKAEFNKFCRKNGLTVGEYKCPTKSIVQLWKKNYMNGMDDSLFRALFQIHLAQCGFSHELTIYKKILSFKKERAMHERREIGCKILVEHFDNSSIQKVAMSKEMIDKVRGSFSRYGRPFPKVYNSILQVVKHRLEGCHASFQSSKLFNDLESIVP
ncbi:unnamed protein product [Caenorhabditis brenneri]